MNDTTEDGHPEGTAGLLQDTLISVFRNRVTFEALERELMDTLLAQLPAPSHELSPHAGQARHL